MDLRRLENGVKRKELGGPAPSRDGFCRFTRARIVPVFSPSPSLLLFSGLIILVSPQHLLNQRMANDIVFVQIDNSDPLDVAQAMDGVNQAAAEVWGKIDLGDIA